MGNRMAQPVNPSYHPIVARLLLLLAILLAPATAPARSLLHAAWVPDEAGLLSADGLPIGEALPWELRLLRQVGERAGLGIALQALEGGEIPAALRDGRLHLALPARPGALEGAGASPPIGERRELLFLPRGFRAPEDPQAALRAAREAGLRVAVVRSPLLGGAEGPGPHFPSDAQAIRAALDGRADAAIVEATAGLAALAVRPGVLAPVLQPLARTPVALAYGPALDPALRARLDAAVASLAEEAAAQRARDGRQAVLRYTLSALPGFALLEWIGLVAFALSGVLLARREGWSLFGGLVLAVLPALGGGLLRDLLVGRRPPFILEAPGPLVAVGLTVLLGWAFFRGLDRLRGRALWLVDAANLLVWFRRRIRPDAPLEVTDALGLAAFTVTGVLVAVRFDAGPLWLWGPLLAALTGAGGGILRDVVRSDPRIPGLRGSFYAEICLAWGLVLSLGLLWLGEAADPRRLALLVALTLVGVFATRMAAWAWGWSPPGFRPGAALPPGQSPPPAAPPAPPR